ncbi:hypothetical protein DDZ13_07650 [Coraliomargarita sinensis]|uniref:SMP-30/Gluconolactonase/LRE-like region domain-containing protein n=1 Tax=Coraliomargarita sinensis TaxID=2174842 RepID=A0A317ZJI7_9BACT|nr:hypothetical protein [Coraliomargarita sinensis]PXA04397.1 hypothetical protein DDZ13_07650 [Coraliomargarita sinensis]
MNARRFPIKQCLLASCVAITLAGCQSAKWSGPLARAPWQAEHLVTIDGFKVPECVLWDGGQGLAYVANVESEPEHYWDDDGVGFISTIKANHQVGELRWFTSRPDQIIHSPKGMCVLNGELYFSDNTRVMRVGDDRLQLVAEGFVKANDLATDGKRVWVSDTAAGKVFALHPDGSRSEIRAPASINGITFDDDKMYGVSWDLHEIYELDPTGEKEAIAFGLAEHFVNLDGIEVLEDGSFIVSDFMGDAVYLIEADRKTVHKLIDIPTPADIGIKREEGLLYVPQFKQDKVSVYTLSFTKSSDLMAPSLDAVRARRVR